MTAALKTADLNLAADLLDRYRDDPMPQDEWLRRQGPIDGSGPPQPMANAVFLGPSAIDMRIGAPKDLRTPREGKLISQWKSEDLAAYYRDQRRNKYR